MRIGLLAEMHVIEVARVLIAKEDAHVAVVLLLAGALDLDREFKIADENAIDQRHMPRTALGRLVFALAGHAIHPAAAGVVGQFPLAGSDGLPVAGALFEVIIEGEPALARRRLRLHRGLAAVPGKKRQESKQ